MQPPCAEAVQRQGASCCPRQRSRRVDCTLTDQSAGSCSGLLQLAACYQHGSSFTAPPGLRWRPTLKRRNSDDNLQARAAAEEEGSAEDPLPLSSSAPAGSGLGLAEAAAAREDGGGGGDSSVAAAAVRHVRWGATQVASSTRQLSGRGAAVLSSAASSTSTVLRSTSGLLRRMWGSGAGAYAVVGSAEAAGGETDDEDAAEDGPVFSPAIGRVTGAPNAMDIDVEEDAVPGGAAGKEANAACCGPSSRLGRRQVQAELELESG